MNTRTPTETIDRRTLLGAAAWAVPAVAVAVAMPPMAASTNDALDFRVAALCAIDGDFVSFVITPSVSSPLPVGTIITLSPAEGAVLASENSGGYTFPFLGGNVVLPVELPAGEPYNVQIFTLPAGASLFTVNIILPQGWIGTGSVPTATVMLFDGMCAPA